MKNLQELSKATNSNVVAANISSTNCYWLLIDSSNTVNKAFWISYYVDGQKIGITRRGTKSSKGNKPFRKEPKFFKQIIC